MTTNNDSTQNTVDAMPVKPDASTSLFTPEQMLEIQAEVATNLKGGYLRNNFIPTEALPHDLFAQVMGAMVSGLNKYPESALFFDPQTVCTMVQVISPTLFIKPHLARNIDRKLSKVLHSAEVMAGVLAEYVKDHASAEGLLYSTETLSPDAVAAKAALTVKCVLYSESVQALLRTFAGARYTMAMKDAGYEGSSLMDRLLDTGPSYVNREECGSVLFSVAPEVWPDRVDRYQAPPMLGLDVLQMLAALTEDGNLMNEAIFSALVYLLGYQHIQVDDQGNVTISEERQKDVTAILAPHRLWFNSHVQRHPNWASSEVPTYTYPCKVESEPYSPGDSLHRVAFRDLQSIDSFTGMSAAELPSAQILLAMVLENAITKPASVALPSEALEGEQLVVVPAELARRVHRHNEWIRAHGIANAERVMRDAQAQA